MIIDARDFEGSTAFGASDVLIIGGGCVGLTLAEALARRGVRSVIVEAGDLKGTTGARFSTPAVDHLPFTGTRRRHFGLGGGFNVWAGQCIRFHEQDFARRPWVAESGWPVSLDSLSPFYAEAEQYYGVSADGYHASVWRNFGLEPADLVEEDIAFRFGVFTPESDVFARDRAVWERRTESVIFYNANVVGIDGDGGSVESVRVMTPEGRELTFSAGRVVVAAGAIETARLLLAGGHGFARGIGNEHGHVGRHLQDHPRFSGTTVEPTSDSHRHGDFVKWFSMLDKRGMRFLPRMVLSPALQERLGLLNGCAFPLYEWPESSMTADMRAVQDAIAGRRFDLSTLATLRRMAAEPRRSARFLKGKLNGNPFAEPPARVSLQVQIEQSPATASRVRLGETRDAFGRPQAAVSWHVDDLELRTIRGMLSQVGGFLEGHGFGRVELSAAHDADIVAGITDSQHQMGTARMAGAASGGVVDPNGKVFGMANLYVSGGSTFPTGSYANPTLTMAANAFRLAAHLVGGRRGSPLRERVDLLVPPDGAGQPRQVELPVA